MYVQWESLRDARAKFVQGPFVDFRLILPGTQHMFFLACVPINTSSSSTNGFHAIAVWVAADLPVKSNALGKSA